MQINNPHEGFTATVSLFSPTTAIGPDMLHPDGIRINGQTGEMAPKTGGYIKRLSELSAIFQDKIALGEQVSSYEDPVVYEVIEYRKDGSDLFFGTTTMYPGDVSGEFFMTRGHFHERRDLGEVYYTQSGKGILLLEDREGRTETVEMLPGVCAFIPPDWAHRSINVGAEKLVFVWVCNPLASNDYGDILQRGMRKLVVKDGVGFKVLDNPAFHMQSGR
ncbi:cupin domain-containing protein [Pararhizobium sp. BT-229]|uniref:glucose-6-phosphate isomerase family protein n=1 Tax=Pararhizobium sp. BT-229 TaxID=2986923 RepID=UPI0021F766F7|nr:glucose-6-phosphate isomerase family protein [Pararhizobium sp. BT-229]MCV9966710.1 cupin domain-containing protein [Pararhizobium sp. BT-229]